jgi:hypothetical protein
VAVDSAIVGDESNSDSAEAVGRESVEIDDKASLIVSEILLGAALSTPIFELRAAAVRLVPVISGYPVSTGDPVIVKGASWLIEAIVAIELLSSALVAVTSNESVGMTTEETSSDASTDVVLSSEGSV